MTMNKLFFLILILACSWDNCHADMSQKSQIQGEHMHHIIKHQNEKFFIGLELRTNNEECSLAMPAHKDRFFKENIVAMIPTNSMGIFLHFTPIMKGIIQSPIHGFLDVKFPV